MAGNNVNPSILKSLLTLVNLLYVDLRLLCNFWTVSSAFRDHKVNRKINYLQSKSFNFLKKFKFNCKFLLQFCEFNISLDL